MALLKIYPGMGHFLEENNGLKLRANYQLLVEKWAFESDKHPELINSLWNKVDLCQQHF